jgi:hypothetical protein
MSAMKDYAMWLDDRGIAIWCNRIDELIIPQGTDIYESKLVDVYKDDAKWHNEDEDDDEDIIEEDEDEEEDFLDDDELGDCIDWSPEEYWTSPDGVLTDKANEMLYTQDSKGELV